MLLVQTYLETHSFEQLAKDHGVYASFSKSGHKWSLNYDMLESREDDLLAQQCRGLVLAREGGASLLPLADDSKEGRNKFNHICPGVTTVLNHGMDRFFNNGQGSAAQINWDLPGLKILQKKDGTLCQLYWDPFIDEWCIATRSVPDADLIIDAGQYTFRTLFEKALLDCSGLTFDRLTQKCTKLHNYCFELCTPYNRIVIDYKDCSVTLLAVRAANGVEIDPAISNIATWVPAIKSYDFSNLNDLIEWICLQDPMSHEGEGVVIRMPVLKNGVIEYQRVKIKNPSYTVYNKIRDNLGSSDRNVMEIILAGTDDDVIVMLPPEIANNLSTIKQGLQKALAKYDAAYIEIAAEARASHPGTKFQALAERKRIFAQLVLSNTSLWSSPFFKMYDGKCSNMKEFIQSNRKEGHWGANFLDKMLELAKAEN